MAMTIATNTTATDITALAVEAVLKKNYHDSGHDHAGLLNQC